MKTCFNARSVLSCKKMKTCFRSNFYLVALTLHKKWKHTSTPQKIEIVALFKAKYTKSMKKNEEKEVEILPSSSSSERIEKWKR
jgi:hypothetical protein